MSLLTLNLLLPAGVMAWAWPGVSALSAAWLFLLIIPLVAFYFLKLRRPQVALPSLVLWRQVIRDQRVNSPFQRFKRHLLLLAQLLLLCLLVLAAMQPFWPSNASGQQSIPVLIDCSASMGATDASGRSRLDLAKDAVYKLIDDLQSGQQLSLIAVHGTAERLTDFSDNPRVLKAAVSQLEVRHTASDLSAGLQLAQALARGTRVDSVLFVSDGNVPSTTEFALPFKLVYQVLPPAANNIGITHLSARRTATGWDVFTRLAASSPDPTLCQVRIQANDVLIAEESVSVNNSEAERVTFRVPGETAQSIRVELASSTGDSLPIDNTAYIELPATRPLRVACAAGLTSVRLALQAAGSGVELVDGPADIAFIETSDVPQPARVVMRMGVVPADVASWLTIEPGAFELTDWNRASPLLQHVQLLDVQFTEQAVYQDNATQRDLETAGYEVLAVGAKGPLVLSAQVEDRREFTLLCHPDRSSLPYRIGFPILIANVLEIARQAAGLGDVSAVATGVLPPWRGTPTAQYTLSTPAGEQVVDADERGLVSGVPVPMAGRYALSLDGKPVREIGVGLLSPAETSLSRVEQLDLTEQAVSATTAPLPTDKPLWRYLVLAALLVLMAEWWLFQRRPGPLWGRITPQRG